jgi:arabinogalactan endo-1,4-beta-galactosidase
MLVFVCCSKDNENKQDIINPIQPTKILEIKGADISFLPEVRTSKIVLKNSDNQPEDVLLTLKKSGVNTIRLRLWKNPIENTSNFTTVKNLTNEIKNYNIKVLLTVHYSDTWADPSQQKKPFDWENLSYNELKDSVYYYTKKIISEINPNYIQIGNEINNGFLFDEGKFTNLNQMKELLKNGIKAVRETNTSTKIIIHYAGYKDANYFYNFISDLDYDIIGISYYPIWHGNDLNELKQNLTTISNSLNKPIFIAETSYPFTLNWNDSTHKSISYLCINSAGVPLSPKVSFTATNSCGVGLFLDNIPATDSPKPPK